MYRIALTTCLLALAAIRAVLPTNLTGAPTAVEIREGHASLAGSQELTEAELRRLPITEVPAENGNTLALFWSGDGGWQELDRVISSELSSRGVAVVGVNSRVWLTSGTRNADSLRYDSTRLLRFFLRQWKRERILLIGFSRGAGFSALLAENLPPDLRSRLDGVVLMGMEHDASFEFHLSDLIRTVKRPSDIPVKDFIDSIKGVPVVCVYGTDEEETVCPELTDNAGVQIIRRPGGHHFDGRYADLAREILHELSRGAARTR